jgi:hypothetical protein
LFLGQNSIRRFSIRKTDLILEDSTSGLVSGHATHCVVSPDGKLAALPSVGQGSYEIWVFNAMKLNEKITSVPNGAYPSAIGFDTITGNIYSPNHGNMQIFSPGGEKLIEENWTRRWFKQRFRAR